MAGGINKRQEETFGDDRYVHYLDCGNGFMGVRTHMSKLFKVYA